MADYLETFYSREEYAEGAYPQLLCNYIVDKYFSNNGIVNIKGKTILDIGSGKGNHLVGFSRHGMKAYGLDKREECISVLEEFDVRDCNIERDPFPFDSNYFDFIFSKSVLEHVANVDNFLSETLRVLKPGGMIVLMTPDWKSQHDFFWDDYTHVKPYTRKSLQNVMLIYGFSSVDCSYFLQLPFLWKYPWLEFFAKIIALLPDSLKWKDKEEKEFIRLIRFSKERMLLSSAKKPDNK